MAEEVIWNTGDHGADAAEALALGDIVKLDSSGEYAKTAAGDTVWLAAVGPAAVGERVAGVKARIMNVKVKGEDSVGNAALAVGDELYVGAGVLTGDIASAVLARATLLEAVGSGQTVLAKVLVA